jgi:bifunctional non-homologous end joining protein LigD
MSEKRAGREGEQGITEMLMQLEGAELTEALPLLVPMIPTSTKSPFDSEEWVYEADWGGQRAIAAKLGTVVQLIPHGGKDQLSSFRDIGKAIQSSSVFSAVYDGELVEPKSLKEKPLFYISDILWLEGYSLLNVPLLFRRQLLEQVMPVHDRLLHTNYFCPNGTELYETIKQMGLKGMIAKRADSFYEPGKKVKTWLSVSA